MELLPSFYLRGPMHIQAALAEFETQLIADGRSPHTVAQYRRHVRLLERWLAEAGIEPGIGQLTPQVLARFLASSLVQKRSDGAPRKPGSANAIRASIRGFGDYLDRAGHLQVNPARLVRRAICGKPKPRAMSGADQKRLLAALRGADGFEGERDRFLFELMLGTGIRLGAALGIDKADVATDADTVSLRFEKGQTERSVTVPTALRKLLAAYLAPRPPGPIFSSMKDARLSPRHAQRRFQGWLEAAGIRGRWSPHSLRHSFATDLYRRTKDVLLVKQLLGHGSFSSTLRYVDGR